MTRVQIPTLQILGALALLLTSLTASPPAALATSEVGFSFTTYYGNVTVTGCVGACPTNLVIPATLGGNPVTIIGTSAFEQSGISTVSIPNSVLTIRAAAFKESPLTDVNIPSSVTSIGASAFYSCGLTSVTLPDSVTSLGDLAFAHNSITSVNIPNTLTSIGNQVFESNSLTQVTIPNSVRSIGRQAFAWNNLTSLIIPNQLTVIGQAAFVGSNSLSQLTIGSSVEAIYSGAFSGGALTTLVIPDSVRSIYDGVFAGNNLTNVTIGRGVSYIGANAFADNDLTNVKFTGNAPDYSRNIYGRIFQMNPQLSEVQRPAAATGWDETWNGWPVAIYKEPLDDVFEALANGRADSAVVNFIAPGHRVALSTSGQRGDGLITFSTTSTNCSVDGTSLVVLQVGDGVCIVTARIAESAHYLQSEDTVVVNVRWADVRADSSVKPSMSGTVSLGKIVSAAPGTWTGNPIPTITYQWYACSRSIAVARSTVPSTCMAIRGATGRTFKITSAQRNKFIAVLVTGTSAGTAPTSWLSTTSVDARATATVKPTVKGTATVASTLTGLKGTWKGFPTPSFTYQWYACTKAITTARSTIPSTCAAIPNATRSTFKLTSMQRGMYVAVLVNGTSLRTTATTWLSKTTAKVR